MLPEEPAAALPGTPEKISVMTERLGRLESLFHPRDAAPDLVGTPADMRTVIDLLGPDFAEGRIYNGEPWNKGMATHAHLPTCRCGRKTANRGGVCRTCLETAK